METKHTPGPWALETVPTTCGVCHKVGPFPGKRPVDKPRYACLYADYPSKGNQPDDELEANARLIAAAPELFDALCELLTDMMIAQGNMRKAAKRDPAWEGCAEIIQPRVDAARAVIAKAEGK